MARGLHTLDSIFLSVLLKIKMKFQQGCFFTIAVEMAQIYYSCLSGNFMKLGVEGLISIGSRMFTTNLIALVHTLPQSTIAPGEVASET